MAFRNTVFYLKQYKFFLNVNKSKNKIIGVTSRLGVRQQVNPPVGVTLVATNLC